MKLPNRERAYVPPRKLTDYLLSLTHPVGRYKARYFAGLGFTITESEVLERELLQVADQGIVLETIPGEFGIKYIVEGEVQTPRGDVVVLATVWLAENSESPPRLITAYHGRGRDIERGNADDS